MATRRELFQSNSNANAVVPASSPSTAQHFSGNDLSWQALGPSIAVTVISTLVVALRWYTRSRIVRCCGWDDWMILLSLVMAWTMCIIIALEVQDGVGIYAGRNVRPARLAKLVVLNNDILALAIYITKASILVKYLRIFQGRTFRILIYTLLFLLLPSDCWTIFAGSSLCHPTVKLWQPHSPGRCLPAVRYWFSAASIHIVLDFLILTLPMPAVTRVRLPRKQQTGPVLVFTLGFFVCIVSVVRLATVYSTEHHKQPMKLN